MKDVISLPFRDQSARERISEDLETNLLVEAGAGSGKTTALVGRMVALVETGTATVEEVAAVTFTRKAASELRERFQIRLEQRVAESAAEGDLDRTDRLRHALDDIDRAFIGTIHAFCARLLRERPLEVGLDPAFEELAVEERVRVRRQFWESYLERLTRDADPRLEELASAGLAPGTLWDLFGAMVENPDVDFPTTDVRMPTREETREVRAELEAIVDHGWELMPERPPGKDWDSLQKKVRKAHFTRDVTEWKEPADFFEALDLLCKPGPNGHKITQKNWKDKGLAKALRDRADAFGVGDTPARRLLGRWFAHRYALVIRLARDAAEQFAEHRIRTGRVDFQDLLVLTARLLRSHPGVRRQLGLRYRRLLVDEFQDTDPLQAELMMLLASEVTPDEARGGRSGEAESVDAEEEEAEAVDWREVSPRSGALFVVGDPKQSIYRFRRADIQLYGFVKERFREFGDVLELTTNFRSKPPIGDLVNEHFADPTFFPAAATLEQAAFEPLNTRPVDEGADPGGVFWYTVEPERATRDAVTLEDAARIASHIAARVDSEERSPGDFLILTRKRSHLATYARALEAHSLPLQVTGAGVGVELELRELQVLLECMIDPTNPVKVVAALVGLFFGIDYERLVQHRLEGGRFDVTGRFDRGHPDVVAALEALNAWWRTAKVQPADIFVAGVVSELGILPYAASGDLGALRAGALVYALDAVRTSALGGDASLPGALRALQAALDLTEAEAPLEPGQPGVVRLMNLHQAKGLEAKVVFLADPTGAGLRTPEMHMARSGAGEAVGYLRVARSSPGGWSETILARPEGWDDKEKAERRFDEAEEVRLLYVAVTRAEDELFVCRWPKKPKASPWAALDSWLDERAAEAELPILEPKSREVLTVSLEELEEAEAEARARRSQLSDTTRAFRSVTDLAKADLPPRGTSRPSADASDAAVAAAEYRGFSWGSAVHGALAAAVEDVSAEALRAACHNLLVEHDRPLDDHGEPIELLELLGVVEAVTASELWARAQAADRVMAEVPFAAPYRGRPDSGASESEVLEEEEGAPRKQLDLFAASASEALTTEEDDEEEPAEGADVILEGVIDLVFREKGGWVVADYKTDLGTDPDFPVRSEAYKRQVDLYADAWAGLTGEKVKERILFYTAQGKLESW